MTHHWGAVFGKTLGKAERNYVGELLEVRNRWAHPKADQPFSSSDTERALDTMARLATAISAPEQAKQLGAMRGAILRAAWEAAQKQEQKRQVTLPLEGAAAPGLRPWRDVIEPHPDVAAGRFAQAEFAADLGQVARGEAGDEYGNPRRFFERTFLTAGLSDLLITGLRRLAGMPEGDPVVELQTNFGGGKTHSMLALYHLVSGTPANELPGVEPILARAGVAELPTVRRAVLVGTALSPGQPHRVDGLEIRTLWGELAWQLGGAAGYGLLAEADANGVSPGSDVLRDLFAKHGPALILIDEWVTYIRQLWTNDSLPAGSFDANITFAQALTEAVKASDRTLLVASLPSSDIEKGGEGGQIATERLKHVIGRIQSPWRPASPDEGFEIVRRRLFSPIPADKLPARDATVQAFADMYAKHPGDFPSEAKEAAYQRRMTSCYPIHPELFDQLFGAWSTLEKFQQTRGVLRLMAGVIHALWESNDQSALIIPATIPIHEGRVQSELTRYLEEQWMPVITRDVDGEHSLPLELDRDNPATLGRLSATRRVARTIYMGSAPTANAATRGIDDRRIKLGSRVPGRARRDVRRRPPPTVGPLDLPVRQRGAVLVQHPALGQPARRRPRRPAARRRRARGGAPPAAPRAGRPRHLRPRPPGAGVRLGRARRRRGRPGDPRTRGHPQQQDRRLEGEGRGADHPRPAGHGRPTPPEHARVPRGRYRQAGLARGRGADVPRLEVGGRGQAEPHARRVPGQPDRHQAQGGRRHGHRAHPRGLPVAAGALRSPIPWARWTCRRLG